MTAKSESTTKIAPDEPSLSTSPTNPNNAEPTKPITIVLPEDLLRKLKVIAVLRDTSVSELVADHVEGLVKRDLKKVLAKLED